ncbi:LOW QUALITY PROTEIN: uncharacterized protein [Cebidichthys violaceus]|uniref:LOW QUALITY PROTEIN: uncharacterized protein n=1 Tax=Cebidichthys violaceus TaxID=271503 RepID=UPI0035CC75D1
MLSPRPLFNPTTLITGASIIRNTHFFNAATHCFPGATAQDILLKLPGLLHTLPSTIRQIIVHVGINDKALHCPPLSSASTLGSRPPAGPTIIPYPALPSCCLVISTSTSQRISGQCFNLTQHIDFPTHNRGHILDLVCSTGITINQLSGYDLTISDHLAIIMEIHIPNPEPKLKRTITLPNIKSVCLSSLSACLTEKFSTLTPSLSPSPSDLNCLFHPHCSLVHPGTPLHENPETQTRATLQKKNGLTVHTLAHKEYIQQYKLALNSARSTYYSGIIHSGFANPEVLFSTVNKLLKHMDNLSHSSIAEKCNSFLSFYKAKIDTIYNQLATSSPAPSNPTPTCDLDPIPSTLIMACLPALRPHLLSIITSSLSTDSVPPALKLASVTPILKKPGLDPDIHNNYKPISNIPFLSKILERAVALQLKTHLSKQKHKQKNLDSNQLYEPFQSGFRSHHSTETALIKVTNDLLLSDDHSLNILVLLDLSAAFDTINHFILLSHFKSSLHITGTALSWFKSYLSNREQFITINKFKSDTAPVSHGVPQGSVLGPPLFILYLLPLGDIIRHHGLHFHCYADDTQLYFSTKSITPTIHSTITNCLTDIKIWMQANFLKLNSDKSEIFIIGPKSLNKFQHNFSLCIGGNTVPASTHVRNLGIIFDQTLSYERHVNHITKNTFFHLKNIAGLRPSLSSAPPSPPLTETLIHAVITCRLDYCNCILYGSPTKIINKLQYIQNSAARLLSHSRTRDHITPVLQNLHWLSIQQIIHFKILLITYKALHNLAPPYLSDLLHRHTPNRNLRSADANLFTPPTLSKHQTWGDRAFSIAAPSLWNSLPQHLRHSPSLATFKTALKTHLFQSAFQEFNSCMEVLVLD